MKKFPLFLIVGSCVLAIAAIFAVRANQKFRFVCTVCAVAGSTPLLKIHYCNLFETDCNDSSAYFDISVHAGPRLRLVTCQKYEQGVCVYIP
jgi:hypothetical protein